MNMTDELILQSWIRAEQRHYQLQPLNDLPNDLGDALLNVQPGGKWLWRQSEALTKAIKSDDSSQCFDRFQAFMIRWREETTYTTPGSLVAWQRSKACYKTINIDDHVGRTASNLLRTSLWYYQTPVQKVAGLVTEQQYDLYCGAAKQLMAIYLDEGDSEEYYAAAEVEAEIMVEEMRRSGRIG